MPRGPGYLYRTMPLPLVALAAIVVPLAAQNASEETGTVVLTPLGARTRVVITVRGEPLRAVQPANVHLGSCYDIETIRHPLHDVRDGHSTTLLDIPLADLTTGGLIIDLQGSPQSLYAAKDARSVSCGVIPRAPRKDFSPSYTDHGVMSGTHDLGGRHGFGALAIEVDEPPFHHEWEARVFALNRLLLREGRYTLDEFRAAVERMPADAYHAASYYERWLDAIERLVAEKGIADAPRR
jgi:nitrile hydratase subunit beta